MSHLNQLATSLKMSRHWPNWQQVIANTVTYAMSVSQDACSRWIVNELEKCGSTLCLIFQRCFSFTLTSLPCRATYRCFLWLSFITTRDTNTLTASSFFFLSQVSYTTFLFQLAIIFPSYNHHLHSLWVAFIVRMRIRMYFSIKVKQNIFR